MATLAKLFVELGIDADGFNKGLDKASNKLKKTGDAFRKVGLGFTAGITVPMLLGGKALFGLGEDFDSLQDTIRIGTGAIGKDLEGLTNTALNVFKSIPTSMEIVGIATSALNQKLSITGTALEDLARSEIELARITGTDLNALIDGTTTLFNSWSIATEHQVATLDKLFRASQATGVPVDTLATQLTQYGPILRSMGFDLDESIALLGQLGKTGVDVGQVITGMRTAFAKFAAEGVTDANAELKSIFSQIKSAPSDLAAGAIAVDIFGTRAGPALAENIRAGRLSYEDLLSVVTDGNETILDAAKATNDWRENLQILRNRISVALLPVATKLFTWINDKGIPIAERLVKRFESLVKWFGELPRPIKIAAVAFAGLLAAIGPILVILGTMLPLITTVVSAFSAGGILAAGGFLAPLVGLLGPLALVIAAIILFGIAYKKNLFGLRDITNKVVGGIVSFIGDLIAGFQSARKLGLNPFAAAFKAVQYALAGIGGENTPKWIAKIARAFGIVAAVIQGGKGLHGALLGLPKPIQKLAIALRRVIALAGNFIKAWKMGGPIAAFRQLSRDVEKIGRTIGNFFQSIGLERFGAGIKQQFRNIGQMIREIVSLVDNIIHGKWSKVWQDMKDIAVLALQIFIQQYKNIGNLLLDVFNLIPWGTIGHALVTGLVIAGQFMLDTGFPWLWSAGKKLFGAVVDAAKDVWKERLSPWLGKLPGRIASTVLDKAPIIFALGRTLLSWLWTGIASLAQWLWNQVWDLMQRYVVNPVIAFFNSMYRSGQHLMVGLIEGIKSGIPALLLTMVTIANIIADRLPGSDAKFGPLKHLTKQSRSLVPTIAAGILADLRPLQIASNRMAAAMAPGSVGGASSARLAPMPALAGSARSVASAQGGSGGGFHIHGPITVIANNPQEFAREMIAAKNRRRAGRAG